MRLRKRLDRRKSGNMVERNSKRGRKPIMNEKKLTVIHTSKKVKLLIGTDTVNISKGTDLMVVRS